MGITFKCEVCSKEKTITPALYRRVKRHFCGAKCMGIGWSNKYGQGKKKCHQCKRIFPRTTQYFYRHRSNPPDYLATECCDCAKKNAGYDAPYRREFIRLRGNKCAQCGFHHENASFFHVDHIKPHWFTGKRYRPQLKHENPDNLQVLCPNCHRLKTIGDLREITAARTQLSAENVIHVR